MIWTLPLAGHCGSSAHCLHTHSPLRVTILRRGLRLLIQPSRVLITRTDNRPATPAGAWAY
ncbi:hypothetical protein [Acetobacter persici]|uniref:hypothetical protein n=1 Tax=Acetobacter persici TaxID=1076596 RepID=UPI001BAC8A52|nr:hypothetical protein [Acetobacter persici]MBS1016902.1 hypothetical protein [Acetobacter persici]